MSYRLAKVNQVIKEELSKIILRELEFGEGVFLTVTGVDTAKNLLYTIVRVSVFPEKETAKVFKILEKNVWHLQQLLNKRLKMRPVPKIKFRVEKKTIEAARVEELLGQIKDEI